MPQNDLPLRKQVLSERLAPAFDIEHTILDPDEEEQYQKWVKHYGVKDVDPKTGEPYDDVKYDMRGYWKENQGPPGMAGFGPPQFPKQHGPDTFKQHGHPTFSQESKYARPPEGGMWVGPDKSNFLEQMQMAIAHRKNNAR